MPVLVEYIYKIHDIVLLHRNEENCITPTRGLVTGLMTQIDGSSYEVAWWGEGTRHSAWLLPDELCAEED